MIIGIDFDNTIARYDELLSELAVDAGVIAPSIVATKQTIRDILRASPDGEMMWQKLQATAYGERMREARLMDGVTDFFRAATTRGIPLCVISHKTIFASEGEGKFNLRDAAMEWMTLQRFFDDETLGLSPSSVYFEMSREAKIKRISMLGCTHFIDDLIETFAEPFFPTDVKKILFSGTTPKQTQAGVRRYSRWKEIESELMSEAP